MVDRLNRSDVHDGILVQSPLPEAMGPDAEQRVFDAIAPDKDVDGFHPVNVGLLVQKRADARRRARRRASSSCSTRSASRSPGAHAVVIGRSDIVGKPMALLLLHRHATVTICHSRTQDLPACRRERGHPRGGHRPAGVRDAGLRQAGRDGHRRRHQPRDRSRPSSSALFAPGSTRLRRSTKRGALVVGDVHPGSSRSPAR